MAATHSKTEPDEERQDLDALSELEDVLTEVSRIEAIASAAVDAFQGLPRLESAKERRAMSRLYGLISAAAQAAETLCTDGEERVTSLAEQRKMRRATHARLETTADFDELARLGTTRHRTPKVRPYVELLRQAQAAVERAKRRLDKWLAAVEIPLDAGAALTAHRMELDHKDAEHDLSVDPLEEASNFVCRVVNGAAIGTHEGGTVPECPGLDGPDHLCGAPVAKGRSLCAACDAESAYRATTR